MKYQDISFIDYNTDQLYVPLDLEIHIPKHHVRRIVNEVVEQLDPSFYISLSKEEGDPLNIRK